MQFARVGVPMVVFVVAGAYGLAQLNQGRYDDRERQQAKLEGIFHHHHLLHHHHQEAELRLILGGEYGFLEIDQVQ